MAIQAQLPANFLATDFHCPPSSYLQEIRLEDDGCFRQTFLQLHNSDLNVVAPSENIYKRDELDQRCFMPARKKIRQDEATINCGGNRQHRQTDVIHIDAANAAFLGMASQSSPTVTVQQSPSGPVNPSPCVGCSPRFSLHTSPVTVSNDSSPMPEVKNHLYMSPIPDKTDFASQFIKQQEEINQIIQLHGEQMKQALEDERRRHTNSLVALIDKHVLQCVQEKEAQAQNVINRNIELENLVKHLAVESQFWQNIARNNEVIVANLRSSLQNALAETQNQIKEGSGESNAEDMESCVKRMPDCDEENEACQCVDEIHNRKNAHVTHCRVCRVNNVCVLALPCRHLCLCTDCDPQTPNCPVCGALKSATVQVYMD